MGRKAVARSSRVITTDLIVYFCFCWPNSWSITFIGVQNNEELGILLAVIFTFAAHRLFVSDGRYLSIADKYRNETKEKQRQRMKQVWIFLAINLIWVILLYLLIHQSDTPAIKCRYF